MVALLLIIIGGLAAGFAVLGSTDHVGPGAPAMTLSVGQTVNVEVTLVSTDSKALGCAMAGDINGLYCGHVAQNKRNPKSRIDARSEAKLLQPFTTSDLIQFMGAGLWMTPALKAKLDKENFDRPGPRFTAKCKLKVEGRTKTAFVQWKPENGWHSGNGWYVGSVSDCKIQ